MSNGGLYRSMTWQLPDPPIDWERDDIKVSLVGLDYEPSDRHLAIAEVSDIIATVEIPERRMVDGHPTGADVTFRIPHTGGFLSRITGGNYRNPWWLVLWAHRGAPEDSPLIYWVRARTHAALPGEEIRVIWRRDGLA